MITLLILCPVRAEEIAIHNLIMTVKDTPKAFFAAGNKYELNYISGSEKEGEFCMTSNSRRLK